MSWIRNAGSLKRLAAFYLLIMAVGVWIVSIQRYAGEGDNLVLRTSMEARGELDALYWMYRESGYEKLKGYLAGRLGGEGDLIGDFQYYYLLLSPDGERVLGNVPNWKTGDARRLDGDVFALGEIERPDAEGWWSMPWADGDYNPDYDLVMVERQLDNGAMLYVARDTEYWNDLYVYYRFSAWALIAVTAVGLGAGLLTHRRVLRNLEKINTMCRAIVQTRDMSRRVPDEGVGNDFQDTIENLNTMLDKVEESMEAIRLASNSIAHDLRTPLTRLRNRLEEMSSEESDASRADIAALTEEVDSLLGTFRSILHISQLEMGSENRVFELLDLSRIAQDAVEMYEPIAQERGQAIVLESEGAAKIEGEANLIFQLLANLLDNATKYAPKNGRIVCSVSEMSDTILLEVSDDGSGIPEELRERVFERFFRMESHRNSVGVGLGLNMVSAIARAHGAMVELCDNEPGLRVRVSFSISR